MTPEHLAMLRSRLYAALDRLALTRGGVHTVIVLMLWHAWAARTTEAANADI